MRFRSVDGRILSTGFCLNRNVVEITGVGAGCTRERREEGAATNIEMQREAVGPVGVATVRWATPGKGNDPGEGDTTIPTPIQTA